MIISLENNTISANFGTSIEWVMMTDETAKLG